MVFSDCPDKFHAAFTNHIKAWKEVIPITNNHAELRGAMHDLFEKIEVRPDGTRFKQLVAEIWSTWTGVEKEMKK